MNTRRSGLHFTRSAGIQRLRERARRGFRPVAGHHGFLEIVSGRLVIFLAMTFEPCPQHRLIDRRQLDARIHHAQRLEDHAFANRRVAASSPSATPSRYSTSLSSHTLRSAYSSSLVRVAAARVLEYLDRVGIHVRVDDDGVRIIFTAREQVIRAEQHGAEDDEMQQRFAQPGRCRETCGGRSVQSVRMVDICLTLQMREGAARCRAAPEARSSCQSAYLTPATSDEPFTSMNTGLL